MSGTSMIYLQKNYRTNLSEWLICQIADNTNTNLKIARLLGVPHIGCMSHKLNLEVNRMISSDQILSSILSSIHNTMVDCKSKIKNRVVLRNLTVLNPLLYNDTRWSGKYLMLKRFLQFRDQVIEASNSELTNIRVSSSEIFKSRVEKYCNQLQEIQTVTEELQKNGATVSDCRIAVDELITCVSELKEDESSKFFGCKLGENYIGSNSHLVPDPHFESGVFKLQQGLSNNLTENEREACKKLEIQSRSQSKKPSTERTTMSERIAARKRKRENGENKYMNTNFILGSVAEVERMWSTAKNILSDKRMRMSPVLLEAILFLKLNAGYWSQDDVCEAMAASVSDQVHSRLVDEDVFENS